MKTLVSIAITFISAAISAGTADVLCSDEINLHFGTWFGLALAVFSVVRFANFADLVNDQFDE